MGKDCRAGTIHMLHTTKRRSACGCHWSLCCTIMELTLSSQGEVPSLRALEVEHVHPDAYSKPSRLRYQQRQKHGLRTQGRFGLTS